jgi:xylulokinase
MNLLGIDVGTTGCKAALFTPEGKQLASVYREYDVVYRQPGWAELDAGIIWKHVQDCIREIRSVHPSAPIYALSISSMGEAVVPVSFGREILGPSILNFDVRGEEFIPELAEFVGNEHLYEMNGNSLGNNYSITKLMWIKKYQPDLYERTDQFLHWGALVGFLLGADPAVDYTLANRSLLFDIHRRDWSDDLLKAAGIDREKLPKIVPSGHLIGFVSSSIASDLNLPEGIRIISGAHDQCANAVGCGVIDPGSAVYGMGTFHCITPVFSAIRETKLMIERGLNTEHHAAPDRFVSFIYNQGGSLVKWYRDTYAAAEHKQAAARGRSIYPELLAEMPDSPSEVLVLPHFTMTGPPQFIADSAGVMVGLRLETQRGEILKGIIDGVAFYLREVIDALPETGIRLDDFRVVGGGSQSDIWIQVCADIFNRPFTRPAITEAGSLGAAIIAGVGSGLFSDYQSGIDAMVKIDRQFDPNLAQHDRYEPHYQAYRLLWPLLAETIRSSRAMKK